jgi:Chaperone of endosialidase
MGGGKGDSGPTQTQQTNSAPWSGQAPYLTNIYKGATQALNQTPNAPWGGPTVAAPRPETVAGQNNALNMANSFQNAGAGTMQLASDMTAGKYLDPNSNPYFSGAVQAANQPVLDQFNNAILPSVRDQAIGQGAYGGDREGITEALATNDLTRNLANTDANMAWQNYANERSLQMWAPQLMQEGESLQMAPSSIYGSIGAARQQSEQDQLNQAQQLYTAQQQAPWTGLDEYAKLIQGSGSPGSSSTQTSGTQGGTPQWLQSLLGVGSMAALAFSDRNLKEDIEPLKDSLSRVEQLQGVSFSMFDGREIGLVAQDVEPIVPEIVRVIPNGRGEQFLALDYSKLTALLIEAVKELSAKVKTLEGARDG